MSSENEKSSKSSEKVKKLTQEQIITQFNQLRQEQKILVTKLSEVEQDLNEHRYSCFTKLFNKIYIYIILFEYLKCIFYLSNSYIVHCIAC